MKRAILAPGARTQESMMRRRVARQHTASAALVLGSVLFSSVASADDLGAIRRDRPRDLSPQNAAFEVRFGPYNPRVDENLSTPVFEEFFGDDNRYMPGFEVDWQIWRAPYVGTLGVGIGWGYTRFSAPNQVPGGGGNLDDPPVSQSSSFNIMPMYGVGVLRVDVLAREFDVPLVPYGKFGLAHAFWWVDDGVDTAETDAGVTGKDTSTGTQAAVGGMFLLDIFEPTSSSAVDAELGVNNSYLFFEWSMSNFGGDQMNVGSSNWVTGLAFEM